MSYKRIQVTMMYTINVDEGVTLVDEGGYQKIKLPDGRLVQPIPMTYDVDNQRDDDDTGRYSDATSAELDLQDWEFEGTKMTISGPIEDVVT